MRILFLTQIVPYPPDAGPKVKTWHVLRYLKAQGHHVTLVTFVRPEEYHHIGTLQNLCDKVYTVPIRRSRAWDLYYLLRSQLSGRPFLIERDDSREMQSIISKLIEEIGYDAVQADQLTMTQFPLNLIHAKNKSKYRASPDERLDMNTVFVFDAHNAVWRIVQEMVPKSTVLFRPFISLEARRIKNFEADVIRHFDKTLAVSEIDRNDLLKALNNATCLETDQEKIEVFPITVDTHELKPIQQNNNSLNILTLGTLHYPPNADGIRWFLHDVFPLVQANIDGVTLTIVGKNPPTDFIDYAKEHPSMVCATGYVPDLDPYFQDAAIAVIPVRAGSGMRVRILEALARGMPLVTTSIGIEGIAATHDREVMIADSAPDFADAVIRMLKNESLRDRLATNGRKLVCEKYDWQVALRKMDQIYQHEH